MSEPPAPIPGEEPAPPARGGLTRRRLLAWIGIGAGGVIAAGGAGAAVRGALNGVWSSGQGEPYELWHQWESLTGVEAIVAAGVLAASPHNTQPWQFTVAGETVEVRSDPMRMMPVTDPASREHHAGLGCAVENMAVAARRQGLDTGVTVVPAAADPELVARVTFVPGAPMSVEDRTRAAAIPRRHSDRGPYTDTPVDADVLAGFEALAGAGEQARLLVIAGATARAAIGELIVRATQAIVDDAEQSAEGFSWFRNDRADIDRYRDGLTLDGQGLDEVTLAFAKILPASSREDGDRFWLNTTRDVATKTAAAYGIVVVDDVYDPVLQFAGGRLLERAHLHATELGLSFQHMNQVTERIDRARATGSRDALTADWTAALGIPAEQALVAFRLGHPTRTPRPSPRRAVTDVVTG
ncbi:Acg family FMN-binding oxidoreductase [Agromyces bauzanensis]|uniref:Nitroreductase domain-containing protein n=1 Tax=Agromyces bauzanensis TaxID=1308924 RepID=A0A917UT60_9MICO|nr:hypothetical protein [Agromyces bauzanensis]GGJ83295.1 hypothetical protein GCM10011372_22020 [Agromyces bauzanensis]